MKSLKSIGLFAVTAAAVILFAGCKKDNENEGDNTPVKVRITSSIDDMATRAAGTSWAAGDRIGITATKADGTVLCSNKPYVTQSGDGVFTPEGDNFYFTDKDDVTFAAYYPYLEDSFIRDGVVTLRTSSYSQQPENQPNFDMLFAKATGNSASSHIQFRFRHCMSRVVLNFLPGEGVTSLGDIKYTLTGIWQSGTFKVLTGDAQAEQREKEITMSVPYNADGMVSSLLFFPQQSNEEITLSLTMRGTPYTAAFQLPKNADNNLRGLESGYSYTYNVKVNNKDMTISPATISAWAEGGNKDIESTN